MKYIDADHLIEKILQLQKEYAQTEVKENNKAMRAVLGGQCFTLMEVVKIIYSLQQEQPDVDLGVEIEKELRLHYNDDQDVYWWNYLKDSFRYFYELGLKARK